MTDPKKINPPGPRDEDRSMEAGEQEDDPCYQLSRFDDPEATQRCEMFCCCC